jgi:hypothetical protein
MHLHIPHEQSAAKLSFASQLSPSPTRITGKLATTEGLSSVVRRKIMMAILKKAEIGWGVKRANR